MTTDDSRDPDKEAEQRFLAVVGVALKTPPIQLKDIPRKPRASNPPKKRGRRRSITPR
jgi:hypothetical protein